MDYQNRAGSKFGGGGVASASETAVDRRERLRKLALETIDISKDPYILRNHLGGVECRLCLTLHTNEGSYLAHTQGKKHQTNLARRAAREARDSSAYQTQALAQAALLEAAVPQKQFVKIGSPGYSVSKVKDADHNQLGLLFRVHYPQIKEGVRPIYRFMSAFEQRVEPPNRDFQYLLVAAEPYATIGFRVPAKEVEDAEGSSFEHFDVDTKQYTFQFLFRR